MGSPHVEHIVTEPAHEAEHEAAEAVHELQETLAEDRGREEGERWARMEAELAESRRLHEETQRAMNEHLASHTSSNPQEVAEEAQEQVEEAIAEAEEQAAETEAETLGTLPVVEQDEHDDAEVTPVSHEEAPSSEPETKRLRRMFHNRT